MVEDPNGRSRSVIKLTSDLEEKLYVGEAINTIGHKHCLPRDIL